MAKKSGTRFHLLIYDRMWQRWAWPCALIALGSFVLWLLAPRAPFIYQPFRPLICVPLLAALLIMAYAYLARRTAWVQCRTKHLYIQTPIYPLAVSYGRFKIVRPTTFAEVFDPAKVKGMRRDWLQPYWTQTVLVVELSKYPVNETWLRLWFSPYLLTPNGTGLVLLVSDWMALSRQLEDFRTDWDMRRVARRQGMQPGR